MGRLLRVAAWPAGITFGVLSLAIARNEPSYSFAGQSTVRAAAELGAGWALLATGLVAWARRPGSRFGALVAAASFGWFLVEWNNPGIGSPVGFAMGLTLYAVAPPLVAHAALAYPAGRLSFRLDRLGLAAAYAGGVLVLGLLPALFFDPQAHGCGECPSNLVAHDSPHLFDGLNRVGVYAGLAWSLALIVLLALRLVRSSAALRQLVWPVLFAAGAYLSLVAADFAHSLGRGTLGNDPTDRDLWLAEAATLVALALGVAWSWVRGLRMRGAVARLVVDLSAAPPPGGLREMLAESLGDPSLELAYPLRDGRLVDARGRPLASEGEVTALVRGAQELALLWHRPGLLDDPGLVEEVAAAARLALENERLQAEAQAQLEDLRASRVRVIATGDAERRRLERDLHDGAQQRLVGLSLSLRHARSRLGPDPDPAPLARVEEAEAELRRVLADLRELAHGIFPAVLADEGLAAALEALAEDAQIPIQITALPDERLDAPVEAAAYFVVSETVKRSTASALNVGAAQRDRLLVIEIEGDGAPQEIVDLEDRVGALDGTLEIVRKGGGRVTIRAEIPCAW
jgi:signal transduction histidine kinase